MLYHPYRQQQWRHSFQVSLQGVCPVFFLGLLVDWFILDFRDNLSRDHCSSDGSRLYLVVLL